MKVLKEKILKNNFTVGIVDLGYVGLPLAIRFIKKNIKVIGVDKNKINGNLKHLLLKTFTVPLEF